MHEETKKWLKEAGWYEGRKIDLTDVLRTIKNSGYEIFDKYVNFMEEFGELFVVKEYESMGEIDTKEFTTCLEDIDEFYGPGHLIQSSDINEKVIPVAICDNGEYSVLMSKSGKFYDYWGLVAETPEELWDHLLMHLGYSISWGNLEKGGSDLEALENCINFYKEGLYTAEHAAKCNNISVEEFIELAKTHEG